MELQPVHRHRAPRFPAACVLDAHPELLRLVPRRWRENPLVLAGLAATCGLILGGCRATQAHAGESALRVAPIFEHGVGRGSFGCRAVTSPVFLSEEDARTAIAEEAKAAGIDLQGGEATLRQVKLPLTDEFAFLHRYHKPGAADAPKTRTGDLVLDGTDRRRGVSFEYVSETDFKSWKDPDATSVATAWHINMLETAQVLHDGLADSKGTGTVAVFYDPLVDAKALQRQGERWDWDALKKRGQEAAKGELRKQVRDFVKWLKAEGVI